MGGVMRFAILQTGIVINVEEWDQGTEPVGAIASDTANIGDTFDGTYFYPPADIRPLSEKQAEMWERIKELRDRRTQTGGYPAAGKWFHSDTFSRTQQLGLVLLGPNIPAGLQWKTMDGSFVSMTQQLAGQIFAAGATQDTLTFAAAETHHAAMLSAVDPLKYDYSKGWPTIYENII
jgi:hypothetical protein